MERILDTPMQHGTLVWPLRPPTLSMVLVVKATYDLVHHRVATLSKDQATCQGMTFFDDDPTASPRLDTDFALVKRAGECFLAGTCHPPDAPTGVSVAAFSVGEVQKLIGVLGDRRWKGGVLGKQATEPEPFEAMPLRWDRAFGGAGFAANPIGRGVGPVLTEDGSKIHPLPNLEDPARPISSPSDRPAPASMFPVPPMWPARLRYAGTYDKRYVEERFPYLAADFDPAFYQAAPPDLRRRRGFWTGAEEVRLKHLSPEQSFILAKLPGLRARGFVERTEEQGGSFEEVPLVLDTITIDADAMRAYCVWRGAIDVADERCTDVRRLFVMHEPADLRRSVEACRMRMDARLRLEQIEASGFVPENPQEDDDARTMSFEQVQRTLAGDPKMSALFAQLAASRAREGDAEVADATMAIDGAAPDGATLAGEAPDVTPPDGGGDSAEAEAPPPEDPPDADAMLEDIYAQLAAEGMDLSELRAQTEAGAGEPPPPPEPEAIREAFAAAGAEAPPEVEQVLEAVEEVKREQAKADAEADDADEEEELDARARALLAYAEGRPLDGDFTDVDLSGEELTGLVTAEGVILRGANLSGCALREAKLDGALLAGANLESADLERASLVGADLTGARLADAKLVEAKLEDAVLDGAALSGADLSRASLLKTEARGADLSGATAEGMKADEADFTRATLRGLQARGASLFEARLHGADASDADLSECNLEKLRANRGARFDRANLRRSNANGARFRQAWMDEVNLSFATLERANFEGSLLRGAIIAGAVLRKAKLIGADLTEAKIQKSDLMQAKLLDANLERADARGSSFFEAELFRARVTGVQWELADLGGTKLEGRVG